MKQLLLLFLLFVTVGTYAQNFSDDFESYTAGDLLAKNSDTWTTWSGGVDGEDATISDVKAASGTNSVYLSSTSENGGPTDIILPFGDTKLESGEWEMNMKMYVEEGANAYFNFQGIETYGEVYAMDFNFYDDKSMGISSDDTWRVIGSYPQGEWFDIKVHADLTLNNWQLFINGSLIGEFKNYVYSISALDLYPLDKSKFYVDDVSISHTPYEATGTDMAILGVTIDSENLVGHSTPVSGVARNLGAEMITSFDVSWTYGDKSNTQTFSGLSIPSLGSYEFALTDKVEFQDGINNIEISTTNANGAGDDSNVDNDKAVVGLKGYTPAEDRAVFVEEGTGTWCGWCPRGAIAMDNLSHEYGDLFAGVAVHYGDIMMVGNVPTKSNPDYEMTDEDYAMGYGNFEGVTGFPSAIIDRKDVDDPTAIEPYFFRRVAESPEATLNIGAELTEANDTSGLSTLNISVTVTAKQDFDSKKSVFVVVKEDNVTGTDASYDQTNYYSSASPTGGIDLFDASGTNWKTLANPVPAKDMVYNHVARVLLGTFAGNDAVPSDLAAGSTFVYNFSTIVNSDWDMDNLGLVAVMLNSDGTVNNAQQGSAQDAIANGFVLGNSDIFVNESVEVYPNPTTGVSYIGINLKEAANVSVDLITLTGQVVATKDFGKITGPQTLTLDNSNVPTGIYLMKVNAGDNFITKKVTFIK